MKGQSAVLRQLEIAKDCRRYFEKNGSHYLKMNYGLLVTPIYNVPEQRIS